MPSLVKSSSLTTLRTRLSPIAGEKDIAAFRDAAAQIFPVRLQNVWMKVADFLGPSYLLDVPASAGSKCRNEFAGLTETDAER